MLFTFEHISDRFEFFIKNWFEKIKTYSLEPVCNLYFGTLYNPHIYLEHEFLSLIQGIESFHQRVFGGKYLSYEDYEPIYDKLINAIPEGVSNDLRERLKGYLKYGNEFSLRKRLKEIIDNYEKVINEFIKDKKAFIDKVVNTRNYYTHYDKNLEERAARGTELFDITQKLKLLLEICLLTVVGFSLEEIKDLLSKNTRYRHLIIDNND